MRNSVRVFTGSEDGITIRVHRRVRPNDASTAGPPRLNKPMPMTLHLVRGYVTELQLLCVFNPNEGTPTSSRLDFQRRLLSSTSWRRHTTPGAQVRSARRAIVNSQHRTRGCWRWHGSTIMSASVLGLATASAEYAGLKCMHSMPLSTIAGAVHIVAYTPNDRPILIGPISACSCQRSEPVGLAHP